MVTAQLILEYLKALTSVQLVVGACVIVFLCMFKPAIAGLIGRLQKASIAGATVELASQAAKLEEEKKRDDPSPAIAPPLNPVVQSSAPNLPPQSLEGLKGETKVSDPATYWEFRYLNHFLVFGTQLVLDWFIFHKRIPLQAYHGYWKTFIPLDEERVAILRALLEHTLIRIENEAILPTDRGHLYALFRGKSPVVKK